MNNRLGLQVHKFRVNNNSKRSKKWRGDLKKPPGLY